MASAPKNEGDLGDWENLWPAGDAPFSALQDIGDVDDSPAVITGSVAGLAHGVQAQGVEHRARKLEHGMLPRHDQQQQQQQKQHGMMMPAASHHAGPIPVMRPPPVHHAAVMNAVMHSQSMRGPPQRAVAAPTALPDSAYTPGGALALSCLQNNAAESAKAAAALANPKKRSIEEIMGQSPHTHQGAAPSSLLAMHFDLNDPDDPDPDGDNEFSTDRRKEQNRIHSKKSREKKKQYIQALEEKVMSLSNANEVQLAESRMKRQVTALRGQMGEMLKEIDMLDMNDLHLTAMSQRSVTIDDAAAHYALTARHVDSIMDRVHNVADELSRARSEWVSQVQGLPRMDVSLSSFFSFGMPPNYKINNMPRYYFFDVVSNLFKRFMSLDPAQCRDIVRKLQLTPQQYGMLVDIWDKPMIELRVGIEALAPDRKSIAVEDQQALVVTYYLQNSVKILDPHRRLFLLWSTRNVYTNVQKLMMIKLTGTIQDRIQANDEEMTAVLACNDAFGGQYVESEGLLIQHNPQHNLMKNMPPAATSVMVPNPSGSDGSISHSTACEQNLIAPSCHANLV